MDAPIYENHADQFIDVRDIDKDELLMVIFNAANPIPVEKMLGLRLTENITIETAGEYIKSHANKGLLFEILLGKQLSVNLSGDEIDARLFDKHHHEAGKLRRIIESHFGTPTLVDATPTASVALSC